MRNYKSIPLIIKMIPLNAFKATKLLNFQAAELRHKSWKYKL